MDVLEDAVIGCAVAMAKAHYGTSVPTFDQIRAFDSLARDVLTCMLSDPMRLQTLVRGLARS